MGDMADDFRAMRDYKRARKAARANATTKAMIANAEIVLEAADIGFEGGVSCGFILRYPDGGITHVYVTTHRIYNDPHHRGPFLKLPPDWTLLDVAQAAAATTQE